MFRQHSIWSSVFFLIAVSVACSSGGPSPQAAPPTATAGVQPSATLPPISATSTPLAPTDRPTDLPTEPSTEPPPPPDTATPTVTVTPTPKPRLRVATVRPRVTAAPLTISYEVVEIKRDQGEQATLMLKVNATGGGGGYRYYHDDVALPGALFKVAGVCGKPFVHTIKVSAANGETVSLPYHVSGVCPTPTP
jgi:hypothetical protein